MISHRGGWKEACSPADSLHVPAVREISAPWKVGPSALSLDGQPRAVSLTVGCNPPWATKEFKGGSEVLEKAALVSSC